MLTEVKKKGETKRKKEDENKKGFWEKGAPGKIFSKKFCGLKIYPYVCSAKTWRLMSDEDLGAAKEKGVSFLILTKSASYQNFPFFFVFVLVKKKLKK